MAVLYLYLNHKETNLQTIPNLISSLLKQLVQGRDFQNLSNSVKELFEKSKGEMRPGITDVLNVLRSETLANFNRVYIVVDALDELSEDDRPRLLSHLENILPEKISLAVTSRAFDDVAHDKTIICNACGKDKLDLYFHCQTCPKFDLCQSCRDKSLSCRWKHEFKEPRIVVKEIRAPDKEIKDFVTWELDQQRGLGSDRHSDSRLDSGSIGATRLGKWCLSAPELIEEIPKAIVSKAQGMYLLAKLHMESLKVQSSPAKVKKALKTLSAEVGKIYEGILERVEDQKKSDVTLARQALAWVVLAHRPLSVSELRQALAVAPSDDEFDPDAQTDLSTIFTVTVGLITADADRGAVRLVHRTAQEYFDENWKNLFPTAATDIAVAIMTYLNFEPLSTPCEGSEEDVEVESRLGKFPFFAYASTYWGEHIQAVLDVPQTQSEVMKFLRDPSKLASTTQAAWYIGSKGQSSATWDVRKGVNVLHVCAWYGLDFALTALLDETPDLKIDSRDQKLGQTPLIYACRRGHPTTVSKLLESGADVNVASTRGSTALFESISNEHLEVMNILLTTEPLSGSLDINAVNPEKSARTALMLATLKGYEDAIDNLLRRPGISVNSKDSQGYTALALAAYKGRTLIAKKILDSKEVELNLTNENGATALMIAAEYGHNEIVDDLLKKQADSKIKDHDGNTAIFIAIANGHSSVVKVMLAHEVALDDLDKSGRTLLHSACVSMNPEPEIVRVLLGKGLGLDVRGKHGQTPLHDAARLGNADIVQMLLQSNADQSIKDSSDRTPLVVAKQNHGNDEIVQLLLDSRSAQVSTSKEVVPDDASLPLWSLAKLNHVELVRKKIKAKGCNLYVKDPDTDNTALHYAVLSNVFEVLCMLLDAGMSPDDVDDCGRTALHLAAELGDFEATERLLQSNAKLDLEDRWGSTPLSTAQSKGNYSVAVLLIGAGACIDKGQEDQIQPTFFAAVRLGRLNVAQLLIKRGADVQDRDKDNQTALQLAKLSGSKEVLSFIRLLIYPPPKTVLDISVNPGSINPILPPLKASLPSLPSPPTSLLVIPTKTKTPIKAS